MTDKERAKEMIRLHALAERYKKEDMFTEAWQVIAQWDHHFNYFYDRDIRPWQIEELARD